jgi:hypothetical protein
MESSPLHLFIFSVRCVAHLVLRPIRSCALSISKVLVVVPFDAAFFQKSACRSRGVSGLLLRLSWEMPSISCATFKSCDCLSNRRCIRLQGLCLVRRKPSNVPREVTLSASVWSWRGRTRG